MGQLEITSIGINIWHEAGFTVDRPRGSGTIVFIHFLSPARVLTRNGIASALPGNCIFYVPPHPQWYEASSDSFGNDWFHAEGAELLTLIERYGLPVDQLLSPQRSEFVRPLLANIQREAHFDRLHRDRAIPLLVEQLLLKLARACDEGDLPRRSPIKAERLVRLRDLRIAIQNNPAKGWTVPEMARSVHLSPSRLAALYREFFDMSPMDDVIRARLEWAKRLLLETTMTVDEVSEASGFHSTAYFCRVFRRREGTTAGRFARR